VPKIKTVKSAAKRFSQTSTGKIMHNRARRTHGMVAKGTSRKRRLANESVMFAGKNKAVRRQLPNGAK
jgi:large subunit ribosomal protein L35